jgi:hypothetical protein
MAPQPQPGATPWHGEQVAEFMASLLGKGFVAPLDEDHHEAPTLASLDGTGEGSLRIFG